MPKFAFGPCGANTLSTERCRLRDLIAAIEEDRAPLASSDDSRIAVEMVAAVFEPHRHGRPVAIPLETGGNPITLL